MPPENDSPTGQASLLSSLLAMVLMLYGFFAVGRAIYYRFSAPATVSLVANLEEVPNGHFALHVVGGVQRRGQPSNGQVLLSVQRLWEGSAQGIHIPLAGGRFELQPNAQFTFGSKDERLLITAEAWTTELPNRPAEAEVYLNATSPWRYKRVIWGLSVATVVALAVAFFWVFTGRASPFKNRMAIVFSYCIMLMFLAIPLTVTNIALVLASSDFQRMEQAPVGIVIAKPWGAKSEDAPQWVLNIGGHVKSVANPVPASTVAPSPVSADSTVATSPPANCSAANPWLANPAPANPVPATSAVKNCAPTSSTIEPKEVEGGIAVPFYVLVLAVIGGAINMARQIPKYHQEGERSVLEFASLRSAAKAVRGILSSTKQQEELPKESDDASDDKQDTKRRLGDSNWRKGLLDQYMFLISAPFLVIITYFLLAWLGVTAVPALVLVSFSVGLITEPIVQRIIDAAQITIGKKSEQQIEKEKKDAEKLPDVGKQSSAEDQTETPADTDRG